MTTEHTTLHIRPITTQHDDSVRDDSRARRDRSAATRRGHHVRVASVTRMPSAVLAIALVALFAGGACSRDETGPPPVHDHAAMSSGAVAPPAPERAADASTLHAEHADHAANADEQEISHYTCSMHPSVHEPKPGKCPICGMTLVPVKKSEATSGDVQIEDKRAAAVGIRFAVAERGSLRVSIRAPGRVVPAESELTDVALAVGGFVRELRVKAVGERVAAGDLLLTLYGPELVAAQAELIRSTRSGGALADAAHARLRRLGIAAIDVEAIARRGVALEAVPVRAPISGFIIEKNVVEGGAVAPGERLLRIAASQRMWIEAELFAPELASVTPGAAGTVRLDDGGPPLDATVSFVSPVLSAQTRTGLVRLALNNAEGRLRPEGWAEVEIASMRSEHTLVPVDAVVHSGVRRIVFVAGAAGRFSPRDVTTGASDRERVELLSGVEAGERVVASGTFLIAAESRLRSGLANR
jgi:Cu(I)/Ag(I) efflux system membrane fusion protein